MRTANIESEVIRMGDVGVVIETVDSALSEGEAEKAERAVVILKEIFRSRYHRLRRSLYGGENDA